MGGCRSERGAASLFCRRLASWKDKTKQKLMVMKRKRLKLRWGLCGLLWCACTMSAQVGFRHPGLLHSEADFQSIRDRVAAGDADMVAALDALRNSRGIVNPGNMAVTGTIIRGISGQNYMNAYRGAAYAYQCALMWKITGETSYADRAVETLNAWRTWNTALGGNTNISLIPGFTGYQFINAAELMRDYRSDAWGEEEFELFKQYMVDVWFTVAQDFLERRHDTVTREGNWYHYHSNWGLGNALFCVSLGILCDSPDIYNYGMYWIKEGPGNESLCVTAAHPDPYAEGLCGFGWGLIPWFHKDDRGPLGYLNQMQESGRDQGHSMAALGLLSYAFQSAYNQGDNAFCNLNNGLIEGEAGSAMVAGAAEYVAAYNAGHDDLPYTTNWWMTGLNATGRGQFRPIWQLFINHYENRMGIPMQFCHEMEDAIGMELGGGSYGGNSGGYDHLGFGDLMHNDGRRATADEVPTLLFPQIASASETRDYAEIRNVAPGTVLTLSASLPEGESDTGNWRWEDGATGSQRQVTVEHSGIYRVTYTNSKGVESTQMFSIAMRGEGLKATLTATVTCNGTVSDGTGPVALGRGNKAYFTTAYANWNYIESEKWYVDGEEVATGGTYVYEQPDDQSHTLLFRLTNQSGVVVEKTFHIVPDEADLTGMLPDAGCEDLSAWKTEGAGFQTQPGIASYPGFNPLFIECYRDPGQDGMPRWGLGRFDISQTLGGLQPGKYTLGVSVIATQQGLEGEASKNYVKDVYLYAGGKPVAVSSQNNLPERFSVDFYVGEGGQVAFGVKNLTDQDHARSVNGINWFAMDNYSLVYRGLSDLDADVETWRARAAAVKEGEVTGEIYSQLQALLAEPSADLEWVVRAQQWLGEADLVRPRYAEFCGKAEAYRHAMSVPDEMLEQALSDFDAAGTSAEFYDAYEAMERAWKAYLANLDRAESAVDLTFVWQNAGLEQASPSMWDDGSGWFTDAAGGNFRVCAVPDENRGTAQGVNMVERWGWTYADDVKLVYQSLSGMPAGRYVFQASAFKADRAGNICLFANDRECPVYATAAMQSYRVSALVEDGQLAVGLRQGRLNSCGWTAMTDIRLTYDSPLVLLDEAVAQAESLDYGTDEGGALALAVQEARSARADAAATAGERLAAYGNLSDAMEAYRLANASSVHPYDMTGWLANAGFDRNTSDGWTLTRTDTNYPKFCEGVMELWHTTFDIHQTLTGLPSGYYRIRLQACSDKGNSNSGFRFYAQTAEGIGTTVYPTGQTHTEGTDVTLHLGQNSGDLNADPELDQTELQVFVGDGSLTLGAACDQTDMWCVMNGFTMEYLGNATLALDENDKDFTLAEDTDVQQVTVARRLKADGRWNTFCVPFDMTAEQLEANHITEVKQLVGAEMQDGSVCLNFGEAQAVEAGRPYLVRVSETIEMITVEHVRVEAEAPELRAIQVDGVTMTGNYAATSVPRNAYFISDNAFYLADVAGGVALKGFRAYVTLNGAAQANKLVVDIEGGVTGIDGAQTEVSDPLVDVHAVNGRLLKRGVRRSVALEGLPGGVYVVGREKVAK